MTYRLKLRDGLKYSNGDDVKASDFKTTIERDFKLDSAGAALFLTSAGRRPIAKDPKQHGIKGIEVHNGTITIHLKQPQADFSNVLASEFAAPVPADAPATDTSLHPLPSTGPYVIRSYQPKSGIVEERNPRFQAWRFHSAVPEGHPDRVTWDIVPDASVALHRVLSGKDDWMSYYQVPSKRLHGIEHKHKSQLRVFTPPNLMYFFMNTRVPPFTSLKVRRAVNYAISRRWLKRLAGGLAGTTENVLPPGYPAYRPHDLYRHDLRKAIRLVHRVRLLALAEEGLRLEPRRPDRPAVYEVSRLGAEEARLPRCPEGRDRGQLLDDDRQREDARADRIRGLHPGLSASARLVPAPRRADDHADAQLELREPRRQLGESRDPPVDASDEADAKRQQPLGCSRPQGDAARPVGAVPQPGGNGLLQLARRPRLLRQQRPLRVRLRAHLRQQEMTAGPDTLSR